MAIIERKQLTGTTEQISSYAGHNGQLAFDKTTNHLHVLSGTAGTSTKLANVSDIPAPEDISGKADKTYVDTELAKKQPVGDYATTTALTEGLAGKANTSHTHTIANITNLQDTLDGKQAKGDYATTSALTTGLAGKAPAYTYGTTDLTAGTSALETGKLYFVYEA